MPFNDGQLGRFESCCQARTRSFPFTSEGSRLGFGQIKKAASFLAAF